MYLAESPAGALIEILVHLELNEDELPHAYTFMRVAVPEDLFIETIQAPSGDDWKRDLALTRGLGNSWLSSGRTAVARVPSAILPDTWNCLFNPERPNVARVRIVETKRTEFDLRLLRNLRA